MKSNASLRDDAFLYIYISFENVVCKHIFIRHIGSLWKKSHQIENKYILSSDVWKPSSSKIYLFMFTVKARERHILSSPEGTINNICLLLGKLKRTWFGMYTWLLSTPCFLVWWMCGCAVNNDGWWEFCLVSCGRNTNGPLSWLSWIYLVNLGPSKTSQYPSAKKNETLTNT